MAKGNRSKASRDLVPPKQCSAHSSRTGDRCRAYAIIGGSVCVTHGGAAPQVREAARKRFLELADDAVHGIEKLAGIGGHGLPAKNEAVRLRALQDVLDRAGLKVTDRLEISQSEISNEDLDTLIAKALEERLGGGDDA